MTVTTLRMGGYQGAASVHTRAMRILAESFGTQTGNTATIVLTENVIAAGRNSTDLFSMVAGDELDLCYFATSYLAGRVPALKLLDLPFQVESRPRIHAALDGALGTRLAAEVARNTPYEVLAWWDNGFRHFSNRLRPLATPSDCAGLAVRSMDNALHQAFYRELGMMPRFIDVRDFPGAIARGEVDAQENPLTNTVNFKLFDAHRFVSMTGHFFGAAAVLVNATRFRALPDAVQAALREALVIATASQRQFAAAEDAHCLATLEAAGVQVLRPENIDRAAFAAATASLVVRETADLDPELLRLLRA